MSLENMEPSTRKSMPELEASDIIQSIKDMVAAEYERENSHTHIWHVEAINPLDTPQHPRTMMSALGNRTTNVLVVCQSCGWPMGMNITGDWTIEQLRGLNSGSDTTAIP